MKTFRSVLILILLFNIGCASVPVQTTSSDSPGKDGQNKHNHQPSVVFKKYEQQKSNTVLNLEGKAVTEFNYDDLNTFFANNYGAHPYKLTPAEHAIMVGDDIAEHIFALVAGLAVLGVIDKNWRPF